MTTDAAPPAAAADPPPPAAAAAAAPAPRAAPAVGGAAILAKLRAQREAKAATAAKKAARHHGVTFLYASQLGTAQEIAKALAAEAEQRGVSCKVRLRGGHLSLAPPASRLAIKPRLSLHQGAPEQLALTSPPRLAPLSPGSWRP